MLFRSTGGAVGGGAVVVGSVTGGFTPTPTFGDGTAAGFAVVVGGAATVAGGRLAGTVGATLGNAVGSGVGSGALGDAEQAVSHARLIARLRVRKGWVVGMRP